MTNEQKQAIREAAEANGLPVKLVEKWNTVFGTIGHNLEKTFNLKIRVEGSIIFYKQYEIFVEIEDKSRVYVNVRVADKLILKAFVRNSTPEHIADLVYMVTRSIELRAVPQMTPLKGGSEGNGQSNLIVN